MFLWNKTSTEWGRICSSWKNCRKYQTKKRTDWSRLASWRKINLCLSPGRCRCARLTRRWAPLCRARWLEVSRPRHRTPSSPWPRPRAPGATRPCLEAWVWTSQGLVTRAPSPPAPTPRPSGTSSSRPLWRLASAATSRFTGTPRYVHSARQSQDQGIQRNQKRRTKVGLKFLLSYPNIYLLFCSLFLWYNRVPNKLIQS